MTNESKGKIYVTSWEQSGFPYPWKHNAVRHAIAYAAVQHASQKRDDGAPYILHLAHVAYLVERIFHNDITGIKTSDVDAKYIKFTSWTKADLITAAWLHDFVEDIHPTDHERGYENVRLKFGAAVEYLVRGLTNGPHDKEATTRPERKAADRERIKGCHEHIRIVKLCDRLANVCDMEGFSDSFKRKYADETTELLGVLLHDLPPEHEAHIIAEQIRDAIRPIIETKVPT